MTPLLSIIGRVPTAVSVVPGLGACAAQVIREGGINQVALLSEASMSSLCPAIDTFVRESPADFEGACAWIVRRHKDAGLPIVVTHREGIRQLAGDLRLRLPYCTIAKFEARFLDDAVPTWRLVEVSETM